MKREILHDEGGLTVALVVDDGQAQLELAADSEGPDLSVADEVVVVVDGRGRSVEVEGPQKASAVLVETLDPEPESITLMVRVYEFFEGWELFAADEK